MKRWKSFTAAALAATFLLLPTPPAAKADEQGWGLMVKSPHVGILYLYITEAGFAIMIKETGAKFVTHAPEWRVAMYNDKSRVYYVERLQDLQSFSKGSPKSNKSRDAVANAAGSVRTGRSEQIGGLPATQYFITTVSPDGGSREAEVWITKNILPPVQLHETMKKIFSIDTNKFPPGLPLRIKMVDEDGKRELIYDTINVQKQTIHTASFSYPPSYKRVDSELAVLMDEKSRKKMESILDDSDDLSSILSSAGTTGGNPSGSGSASRTSATATKGMFDSNTDVSDKLLDHAVTPRPVAVAPKPPAAPGPLDWWNNIMNAFSGK
jgi:hypothetical protein